ncbi:MAG: hypothetical protein WCK73_13970 [Deltaproteobacteria bacterium]
MPRNAAIRSGLLLLTLCAGACKSSAPYSAASMAINGGLAAGASALSRSQGGCYAMCVGGTVCNTRTGFCDPVGSIVCLGIDSDPPSCLHRTGASMGTEASVPGGGPETVSPVGISPATGRPPPQPGSTGP